MTETYAHTTDMVPQAVPAPADDDIPDFSRKRSPVRFRLNGRVFNAVSAVPAQTLIDFTKKFADMDPNATSPQQQLEAFTEILTLVLPGEELTAFTAMLSDTAEPVDMEQVDEIVGYLFEKYGLRPTPQPSGLSAGLPVPEYGTSSTGSAPVVVSIPLDSPSTAS